MKVIHELHTRPRRFFRSDLQVAKESKYVSSDIIFGNGVWS